MAKKLSTEELKAKKTAAQEKRDAAKAEFKSWCKEQKIDQAVPPTDEKKLKKYTRYKKAYDDAVKEVADIKAEIEATPKEKKERVTKYDYPEGASSEDKKKFRTAARAAAKKAAKEEAGGGKKKTEKKGESKDVKAGKDEKKKGGGKDKDKAPKENKSKAPKEADEDSDED